MGLVYLVFGELANDFLTKDHRWPVLFTGNKVNYTIDNHGPRAVTENACCTAVGTVYIDVLITVANTDNTAVMITAVGADFIADLIPVDGTVYIGVLITALITVLDSTVNTVYIDALS